MLRHLRLALPLALLLSLNSCGDETTEVRVCVAFATERITELPITVEYTADASAEVTNFQVAYRSDQGDVLESDPPLPFSASVVLDTTTTVEIRGAAIFDAGSIEVGFSATNASGTITETDECVRAGSP